MSGGYPEVMTAFRAAPAESAAAWSGTAARTGSTASRFSARYSGWRIPGLRL